MLERRDQKVRVLEALSQAVRQFRTREGLWPLRVPAEPLVLEALIRRTVGTDARRFEVASLRSRSLLRLAWDEGGVWELWILALPNGLKLYCDSGTDESRVLASGRRDSEIDTDRLFLELLSESAGETFGIGFEGGPPARVQSSLTREQLTEFFVQLFEVAGMEEDVRGATTTGDFRLDVERWLEQVAR